MGLLSYLGLCERVKGGGSDPLQDKMDVAQLHKKLSNAVSKIGQATRRLPKEGIAHTAPGLV